MAQIFKSLIGETLEFSWPITTSGQIIPLEGRNLSLVLVGPDNVEIPLDYTIEHINVVCFTYEGASQSVPGIYTATLYENRGEENQAVVDQDAFELVETIDLFNWGNNTSLWSVTKHESKEDGGVNTLVLRFSNRKTFELHTVNGSKGTGSYDAITDEEIDAMFNDESSDQPTVLRFASQDGLRRFLNKLKTMFVDGLGVSEDTLTWTVGNRVVHITVPFATKAAKDANGNDISATYATKNEVNAKQDTIDDLEEIRRGARLGATSIQEHQDISGKQDNIADLEEIRRGAALGATSIQQHQDISGKQDKLVSGGNIKTVNGQTLLGEGDIVIIGEQGVPGDKGDPFTYEDLTDPQKAEIAKDATAAAQQAAASAQDAANSASAAEQKVTIIDNAIKSLDPSQSTDDAVVALAAKQGAMEADLTALGPKISYPNNVDISDTGTFVTGSMRYNKLNLVDGVAYGMLVYEVVAGTKYSISGVVQGNGNAYQNVGFVQQLAADESVDIIVDTQEVGSSYSATYTPSANGYICVWRFVASYVPSVEREDSIPIKTKISEIEGNVNSLAESVEQTAESLQGDMQQLDEDLHDEIQNLGIEETKYVDISPYQSFISGYATTSGEFVNIGGSIAYGFTYIAVSEGVRYRLKGTYKRNGYANIIFSSTLPTTGDVGVVITSGKTSGTAFDEEYTPHTDGYILIFTSNSENFYQFLERKTTSLVEETNTKVETLNETVFKDTSFEETQKGFITGICQSDGSFRWNQQVSYGYTYFPVEAGRKYNIKGTYGNFTGYAGIVFRDSVPTKEYSSAIVIEQVSARANFDVDFTPDYDGYVFVLTDSVTATYSEQEQQVLTEDVVYEPANTNYVKLVGVAYQQKYIYVSTHSIVESASGGCFIIPVVVGEKYLIRGIVKAFSGYAVVGFTDDLTAEYTGAKVLLSVSENTDPYSYSYNFEATANGYLMVWCQLSVYGSSYHVEILKLAQRIKGLYDYGFPSHLKIQTFGDSITDNHWGDMSTWVNYIPDNIKMENLTIVNSAVGGAGIGGNGAYNIPNVIQNGYTRVGGTFAAPLSQDADLVVIFCGTNDWAAGGAMNGVLSNLASAFQYIIENSKAKILYCTPLQRYNETDQGFDTDENGVPINGLNMTLREFCDEVIKVCKRFSVPVLDLNAEANINRYNIFDYSEDGLHPHRDGDIYVSWLICNKIKSMFRGYNYHL